MPASLGSTLWMRSSPPTRPRSNTAARPRRTAGRTSQSGYTSGGEQQMTAVGRALMAQPSMILLDEPSMGLAPQIVEEIFEIVQDLNAKERVSFLLAEQNTMVALRYANYGYILENGRVVMDGTAQALRDNEDVKEFYLGLSSTGRKSFSKPATLARPAGSPAGLRCHASSRMPSQSFAPAGPFVNAISIACPVVNRRWLTRTAGLPGSMTRNWLVASLV